MYITCSMRLKTSVECFVNARGPPAGASGVLGLFAIYLATVRKLDKLLAKLVGLQIG